MTLLLCRASVVLSPSSTGTASGTTVPAGPSQQSAKAVVAAGRAAGWLTCPAVQSSHSLLRIPMGCSRLSSCLSRHRPAGVQSSASHELVLQVELLSQQAQDIIRHYTAQAGPVAGRQAALCAATGVLPWNHASVEHFERLASVSPFP